MDYRLLPVNDDPHVLEDEAARNARKGSDRLSWVAIFLSVICSLQLSEHPTVQFNVKTLHISFRYKLPYHSGHDSRGHRWVEKAFPIHWTIFLPAGTEGFVWGGRCGFVVGAVRRGVVCSVR